MICPKCHSTDIEVQNETIVKDKYFSPCLGIIGFLINPIFILCGLCGSGRSVKQNTKFVCRNCGTQL